MSTIAARLPLLLALAAVAACGRTSPPTPSPPTTPGETITGRERLGWDQQAANTAELATFRYAIYVDGARSELSEVICGTTAGAAGFACSGRLPPLTNGAHTLELAAFILETGGPLESARSAPLRVTVTALTAPPLDVPPLAPGEIVTTADRVRLKAERVATGLHDIVDVALLPDGRSLVAERSGRIWTIAERATTDDGGRKTIDGGVTSLTVDPEFVRTGHVFVLHTPPGAFRIVRYRVAGDALVDRMPLIRDVAASADGAAVIRFGLDGKLYAAFDDGGSRDAAERASEWNGKILRLNADGSTPDDQPTMSPVFWSGLRAPRGLAWMRDAGTLWITEERPDRVDRLLALGVESLRPRRSAPRASYPLPSPFGARTLAFHPGGDVPELRGSLLIAAHDAGYLLRVRFDPADPHRVMTSERLLEGRIGAVRSVAVAGDGAIYVASESALWRLSPFR